MLRSIPVIFRVRGVPHLPRGQPILNRQVVLFLPNATCGARVSSRPSPSRNGYLPYGARVLRILKNVLFYPPYGRRVLRACSAGHGYPTFPGRVLRGVRLGYMLLYVRNVVAGARNVLRPHIEYYTGAFFRNVSRM